MCLLHQQDEKLRSLLNGSKKKEGTSENSFSSSSGEMEEETIEQQAEYLFKWICVGIDVLNSPSEFIVNYEQLKKEYEQDELKLQQQPRTKRYVSRKVVPKSPVDDQSQLVKDSNNGSSSNVGEIGPTDLTTTNIQKFTSWHEEMKYILDKTNTTNNESLKIITRDQHH